MKVVSDTNIFLAVALEEESKSRIIEITDGCSLHAPEILYYEIGNALSAMIKRRQIETSDVQAIYSVTQQIPVSLAKVSIPKALEIAIEHNIYAYDAYFLEVAQTLSSPLLTLDTRLKTVAQNMSIETLE